MTATRTYLDCNASAPLRPAARAAMLAAHDAIGNPSSVHAEGRRARAIIDTAREQVAALIGAKPSEVVFASGATEANNCVMAAGWEAICVSAIEHDSVLAPARACGARLIELPAGAGGIVDLPAVADALAHAAASGARTLLSVMLANNETGVIQPVAQAAELARMHGVPLHVDAVQGPGRLPVNFAELGADALVVSAHKLGGPRGVGALIVRDGVNLPALIRGGGQERRRRCGTENVAGIAGFGAAAAEVARETGVAARIEVLRDRLEAGVTAATPGAVIIGGNAPRIGNTSCIAVPGKSAETLVIRMDLEGVAISAGAACSSGKVGANSVLEAMGLPIDITHSAVRVSLGPETSEDDIAAFLAAWEKVAGGAALAA
ncbi:MAG: cysteine desulfurase [Hyphomicrobium sp.]|uniref:cysteine desulfurase family protein n=1 Tax=Hyphomicrobium sp. TaxID=82 RepID=UPI00132347AE|nr:cysteine desulfurase family protein [Hyphomicrobium sp.]KAB2937310.1 MAG: cysteine desulfurase [Hyphomicrobium sp.]MBZ0211446.1 cysteine desulfurase [Hyphomicrobium sp.]